MRAAAVVLTTIVVAACSSPKKHFDGPPSYDIPIITQSNTVDYLTHTPEPGETDRALFCVETPAAVLCYFRDKDNNAYHFVFPRVDGDEYVWPRQGT